MNDFKAGLFGVMAVVALGLGGCAATTDAPSSSAHEPATAAEDTTSAAAAAFDFSTCNWTDTLPPGSYLNSCDNCTFTRGVLACTCDKSNGTQLPAKLTLTSCPDTDIPNCEGTLGVGSCFSILNKRSCVYSYDFGSVTGPSSPSRVCEEYDANDAAGQAECASENGVWSDEPCGNWN